MVDYIDTLGDVDYLSVLFAVLSTVAVGAIWYDWRVFGQKWAKLVGIKKKDFENPKGKGAVFGLMFLSAAMAAISLAVAMLLIGVEGAWDGALLGALVGVTFRLTAHMMHNGFANRGFELTVIDGTHDIVQLAVMGVIIGVMI